MRALFRVLLPLIDIIYMGRLLKEFWTVHLAAVGDEDDDDDIRTISSDTYAPPANKSNNDDTCERMFHWDGCREVQRERRVAAREHARFRCWMVEYLGERGQGLVDTFHASLAAEYAAGQYPSPPVGQVWEIPASSPSDSHGGSSSSFDELFEDDGSADVADHDGMIQGVLMRRL